MTKWFYLLLLWNELDWSECHVHTAKQERKLRVRP